MASRVRIRINKNTIKVLSVASSSEEFERLTIRDLKRKALSLFPGVNDPNRLRVIFGQNELEDDQTFQSYNIEHLSLLVIVLRLPEGRGTPDPGGTKAPRRVNEAVGLTGNFFKYFGASNAVENSDWLKVGRSFHERRSEIQDYNSLSAAAESLSIADHDWRGRPSTPSNVNMRDRREESAYQIPEGASAVPSDPDLHFVLNLLPSLKRMDLRHREHTKLRIQQLMFEAEFEDSSLPKEGIRRTNSSENFRPDF
ncbi:uncharacterized protein LOC125261523 isoform X1 [Megalobrama amblycephala]|uniref:uncharacterized protein LOC125261523 isoform X1 n=1 Tax=Megalobrama amblycephala TaxID=75352 RepID=UPI002013FDD3|nr:uncharacterized protein LOC125261523 isoform X1 [Megalobrama amblycephala]